MFPNWKQYMMEMEYQKQMQGKDRYEENIISGAHRGYAPYYIRRVRITSSDPLAKVMLDLGFTVYPETGQGPSAEEFNKLGNADKFSALEKASTWVIEFPIKTSVVKPSSEETAIEQYERYLLLQKTWTDHNTSITISVGTDEWETLTEKIYGTWNNYIGVSFIPKDNTVYPLMPYEAITEEEYNRRANIDTSDLYELLTRYERTNMASDLDDADCISGACPVR
jgi:hypothetical protein